MKDFNEINENGEWMKAGEQPALVNENVGYVGKYSDASTKETRLMKDNCIFFASAALIYAVFYVLCMYENGSGVTFPFFVSGTVLLLCLYLSKLENKLKKGSIFYIAAMLLLGVSTFCTDDARLIFFNKLGIFLLMMSLLLKQFFNTSEWKIGKYFISICSAVASSINELGRPVSDLRELKAKKGIVINRTVKYAVLGALLAVPMLLIVIMLLSSADALFRQFAEKLLEGLQLGNIVRIGSRIVTVFFATYALTAFFCKKSLNEEVCDRKHGEPVLAITVTSLLTLIYLLFSIIQIAGLFMGKMQLPENYTYAMYAREGFFQLLAVSLINLVIVLACMTFFKESLCLKAVLAVMSGCTFIMIASSALRMIIYIRFYYLTALRILVLWALAALTVVFIGVVISIFKEKFPLFRYSVAAVTVLYIALSFAHPDYIIAKVNIANSAYGGSAYNSEKFSGSGEKNNSRDAIFAEGFFLAEHPYDDFYYLGELCADAAPALVPYMKELGYDTAAFEEDDAVEFAIEKNKKHVYQSEEGGFGYYWMESLQERTRNFGIRTFNVSRYSAMKKLS